LVLLISWTIRVSPIASNWVVYGRRRVVIGQVVPTNPAAAVRGPKHVVKTGKTPVLEGA